jgi:hypothetical protein
MTAEYHYHDGLVTIRGERSCCSDEPNQGQKPPGVGEDSPHIPHRTSEERVLPFANRLGDHAAVVEEAGLERLNRAAGTLAHIGTPVGGVPSGLDLRLSGTAMEHAQFHMLFRVEALSPHEDSNLPGAWENRTAVLQARMLSGARPRWQVLALALAQH